MVDRGKADQAVEGLRADYDVSPYESFAHPRSSPGHLAAIALAFGLASPDVSSARVLEIGCASGGNLVPFAAMYPGARVVGLDLSQVQIEQGRQRVIALGLDNVELVVGDIARTDLATLGSFDFIVCHGVFSWVPNAVQESILTACQHLLAPDGIAYLSYNVYPGWKAKEIVRDAMLLSADRAVHPADKVRAARGAVDFLQSVAQPDGVLARALADHQEMAAQTGDYYLLHEELEAFNIPCYFRDLMARARAQGLEYLADAQPQYMFAQNYGPMVVDRLFAEYGHDQVLLEQHLDFVLNRSFRETLLVHAARGGSIRHRLDRSSFGRLNISALVPPITETSRLDDSSQQYGDLTGRTLVVSDSSVKAALDELNARWPWTLSRQELMESMRARLVGAEVAEPVDLADRLDALLEVLITEGHARIRLEPVRPTTTATPMRLDEPARRMAELTRDHAEAFVFNRWHEMMPLAPVDRYLLPLLDGTHDDEALLEALVVAFGDSSIRIEREDGQALSDTEVREVLAGEIEALPRHLAELGLLCVDERTG